MNILVLIGPPCAGKSTFAKNLVSKNKDWMRFNRDDYRFMIKDHFLYDKKLEKTIFKIQETSIKLALKENYNIVMDNTHCKIKDIMNILDDYKEHNVYFKCFDEETNILLKRNLERHEFDFRYYIEPEHIIQIQKNFEKLTELFDFDHYQHINGTLLDLQ